MLIMPDAQVRAIEHIQLDLASADDPVVAAGLDHAVDYVLMRDPTQPYLERNARRDGRSLALKRKRREPSTSHFDDVDDPAAALTADPRPNPEREAIFNSDLRRLEQLLQERSGRARDVLDCWARDLDVAETAAAMGISISRVKELRALVREIAVAGIDNPAHH